MNILVTGNMGYIGSYLCEYLSSNYRIFGLDSGFFSDLITDIDYKNSVHSQSIKDIRDICLEDLTNIDCVVHLCALSNDPIGNKFPVLTNEINYKSTKKLLNLCIDSNVNKFIFASSCSLYGFSETIFNSENDKLNPLSSYSRSKSNCEKLFNHEKYKNLSIISLRFSTACGYSPRMRLDLVLNDFVANSILRSKIKLLSSGKQYRPLIDVEDMCKAIEWSISFDSKENPLVLNIGSEDNNYRIIDLAVEVKKVLPNLELEVVDKDNNDARSYKVDFTKYRNLNPDHKFKDISHTIKELHKNLRIILSNRDNNFNFRKSSFSRLYHLKYLQETKKINKDLYYEG